MKPLVSIITPSYNQGKFIRETIESVLQQKYENIEYIIIDGGSTDNSLDIIKEYEDRLTYISEKDNGQSDAINKGFRMAHGEIVAWLNSDDVYEPDCIEKAVEEFIKNDKVGLVYGDGYIIDEFSNKLKIFEYTQEFDFWKLVNFWDYIMQPATFFKRKTLQDVGYLDENLHYCMDWDLWIKLAAVSEVKYIPELLACSREYGETKTSTGGDKRLVEITKLLQKYSGKQVPLGVKSYRASTFYTKNLNAVWPIRKFAGAYLTYIHKYLNSQIPQKYEDGWIGKRYYIVVPEYIGCVRFIIEAILPGTFPQKVSLYINSELYKIVQIEHSGSFEIIVECDNRNQINEIGMDCEKVVKASKDDTRKLSFLIKEMNFIVKGNL